MGEPGTHPGPSRPSVGKIKCMIPQNLQRKHLPGSKARQRAATAPAPASEGPALPVRLTSCIFPRPVTLLPARPGDEVRCGPQEAALEKPRQLCARWRPRASGRAELARAFGLAAAGSRRAPRGWPAPGPAALWKEMVPEAAGLLPPSASHHVTAADIQEQADKVKKARQRLALALEADRLAREAERMRGLEEGAGDPAETGAGAAGGSKM